jgi:hypothetical protein
MRVGKFGIVAANCASVSVFTLSFGAVVAAAALLVVVVAAADVAALALVVASAAVTLAGVLGAVTAAVLGWVFAVTAEEVLVAVLPHAARMPAKSTVTVLVQRVFVIRFIR